MIVSLRRPVPTGRAAAALTLLAGTVAVLLMAVAAGGAQAGPTSSVVSQATGDGVLDDDALAAIEALLDDRSAAVLAGDPVARAATLDQAVDPSL